MFFLKLPSIQIALQSRRNFSLALSKCFGTFYAAACMLVAEWTANAQTFVKALLRALPFRARDDGQSGKIST